MEEAVNSLKVVCRLFYFLDEKQITKKGRNFMKERIIFSLKVANELVKRGFEVKDTQINIKYPEYKVFLFEESNEIRKALKEITQRG